MTHAPTYPDLAGASAFVTGGAGGIGAGITEALIAAGARVATIGRSDPTEFADGVEARTGTRPLTLRGDVTDTAELEARMDEAAEAHGPIRALICNAANDMRMDTDGVDDDAWDDQMAVNLRHYFMAARHAARTMPEGGAMVMMSSTSYMMGMGGMVPYTTANGAITALSRSLARELGPRSIRVNAVAPGWVLTDKQLEKWATPEKLAAHLEQQCLPRHLNAADIADPVVFLCSSAARMITGQLIPVDGGLVFTG
ncbi:MAG: SDR family NAD(P)-dependent oxidoreductase [Paracoccaceae bacterium]